MSEPQEKIDISDLKETFLECPVCVEHFNQTDKRPRLLHSCLHAFCTQCLDQLLLKEGKGQITCPLCRQVQKVTGKVDTLPADPVRGKLVDFLQIKHKQRVLCTECEENDAVSLCKECQCYLCKDCDYVHKRHKVSKDHTITPLEEVLKQPIKTLSKGHFCPIHPKHHLEFYCVTEEQLCCVSCTVLAHKGHELLDLDEAASQRKQELETRMTEVHMLASNLRNSRNVGRQQEKYISDTKSKSLSEIAITFDEMRKVLDHRQRQLEAVVHDKSNSLLSVVQKTSAANDQTLAIIESTDTYFAHAKEKAYVVEMLQMYPAIKRSVDVLERPKEVQHFSQTLADFSFLDDKANVMQEIIGELGSFGKKGKRMASHCYGMPVTRTGILPSTHIAHTDTMQRLINSNKESRRCPRCPETFPAEIKEEDFMEHVLSHMGRICPVCKMQIDDSMETKDFEYHVHCCIGPYNVNN